MGFLTPIPYTLRHNDDIRSLYKKLEISMCAMWSLSFICALVSLGNGMMYLYLAQVFLLLGIIIDGYKMRKFAMLPYEDDV